MITLKLESNNLTKKIQILMLQHMIKAYQTKEQTCFFSVMQQDAEVDQEVDAVVPL